jgi:hypothetical protein
MSGTFLQGWQACTKRAVMNDLQIVSETLIEQEVAA